MIQIRIEVTILGIKIQIKKSRKISFVNFVRLVGQFICLLSNEFVGCFRLGLIYWHTIEDNKKVMIGNLN